jgi:hypothetical protein
LTDIDLVPVRDGKNLKGWLVGLVVGTLGKGVLEKAFKNSVKAIEARNGAAREVGAARPHSLLSGIGLLESGSADVRCSITLTFDSGE